VQRLKRDFNIDVNTCGHGGGTLRIVASIEEPTAIRVILAHFEKHGALEKAHLLTRTAHRRLWPRDTLLATMQKAKSGRQHAAAKIPQGRAWPAVGNRWEIATDSEAARPRDAEIPLTNIRSAPKLALARPPPTRRLSKRAFESPILEKRAFEIPILALRSVSGVYLQLN